MSSNLSWDTRENVSLRHVFFITTNGQRQITTLLFNCLCDLRGKLDFMDILLYHKRENFLKEEWRRCMMSRKLAIVLFILAVCGTGSQQINAAADDYTRPEQNMLSLIHI